jgi:MFS family permease
MDVRLLFSTRIVRLFAYGFVSIVLVLYLAAIGIDEPRIGLLLTLTLAGDVALSLYLTTHADLMGRRRTLVAGALLMVLAAIAFAFTRDFTVLVLAATLGVISPSGNEVGPFLAVEQVALTEVAPERDRTSLFAWYNLSGSFATALGSLAGGALTGLLLQRGFGTIASYRSILLGYAILGGILALLFTRLSCAVEAAPNDAHVRSFFRLHRSRGVVARLSGLFALDSFAGGLVVQSIVAFWFARRFGLSPAVLGAIFFGANVLAGVSALAAARIARSFGLLNTMVFTHLPSNVLLLLVPFMPTLPLAIAVLLLRFSISQMDVPTRQSYVMAVVDPSERTAAAGITGVARTTGAALAPLLALPLIAGDTHWLPFVVAGALKIVYDLALLRGFRESSAQPRNP